MKATAKMISDTEQTMKLEQLYKVGSECELKSWPVAQSVRASARNSVVEEEKKYTHILLKQKN